jgi:hypothetical protein
MREQAMEAHADAETARHPPEKDGHGESFPTEHEERGYRAEVEDDHEERGRPVNAPRLLWISELHLSLHYASRSLTLDALPVIWTRSTRTS